MGIRACAEDADLSLYLLNVFLAGLEVDVLDCNNLSGSLLYGLVNNPKASAWAWSDQVEQGSERADTHCQALRATGTGRQGRPRRLPSLHRTLFSLEASCLSDAASVDGAV